MVQVGRLLCSQLCPMLGSNSEVRIYRNREAECQTRDGAAGVPEAAPHFPPESILSPKLH